MENIINGLSDEQLIELTKEYSNKDNIPLDSLLRTITKKVCGNEDLISMLSLAVPISQELALRLEARIGKETRNPWGITKKSFANIFYKITDDIMNGESAVDIKIEFVRDKTVIEFNVDCGRLGTHSNNKVIINNSGLVRVYLADVIEGSGIEDELEIQLLKLTQNLKQ